MKLLAAVTGAPKVGLMPLLEEAAGAGVLLASDPALARYRFAHPLLREALYADLPASERAALHHRVGETIAVMPDATSEWATALAHHFYLAAPACGPGKALEYGLLAARRAIGLLAYEEAVGHFEHALQMQAQLGGGAAERVELLLDLGDARMRAGDWPGAVEVYEQAAASARRRGDAEQLARAALGLGAGLSGFEVRLADPRQLALLEEAREKLQADSPLRA